MMNEFIFHTEIMVWFYSQLRILNSACLYFLLFVVLFVSKFFAGISYVFLYFIFFWYLQLFLYFNIYSSFGIGIHHSRHHSFFLYIYFYLIMFIYIYKLYLLFIFCFEFCFSKSGRGCSWLQNRRCIADFWYLNIYFGFT